MNNQNIIKKTLLAAITVSAFFVKPGFATTIEDIEDTAKENCISYHIEPIVFGNIKAYDITCINENETFIYNFVEEQLVSTHYLGK